MPKEIKRIFPKQDLQKVIADKHKIYNKTDFYKPISIAIQGNNYCSLGTCKECGLNATNDRTKATQLPKKKILSLLKEAPKNGIFLYYTNFTGEITDDLDFFKEMLQKNPGMDAYKINTNCSRFTGLEEAEKIFRKLKEIGWTKTNYVIPTCALSIGMQEHRVPLINVAHGIEAFNRVFKKNEAKLFISHYYTTILYKDTFKRLEKIYKKIYGKKLSPTILKSDPITYYGRAKNLPLKHFKTGPLPEFVSELNCFGYWHKKYVCPEIYVHRNYSIYTCPLFELKRSILLGSARRDTLKKAIRRANNNPFLRLISEKGTKGVYELVKEKYPEIKNIKITNRHEACEILGDYYSKLKSIQD